MPTAIMYHRNLLSPVFFEVILMSFLRHNRPQHPPLHSTAPCITTVCTLILITRGCCRTSSKNHLQVASTALFGLQRKKAHNFGRLRLWQFFFFFFFNRPQACSKPLPPPESLSPPNSNTSCRLTRLVDKNLPVDDSFWLGF